MKIQWDPYTGQFLDLGDDAEEIGVPSRTPPSSSSSGEKGSKATGLKTEDLQLVGGNIGKANAYIAQKLMEASIEEGTGIVDALMKVSSLFLCLSSLICDELVFVLSSLQFLVGPTGNG
jgi:hypothetical protein